MERSLNSQCESALPDVSIPISNEETKQASGITSHMQGLTVRLPPLQGDCYGQGQGTSVTGLQSSKAEQKIGRGPNATHNLHEERAVNGRGWGPNRGRGRGRARGRGAFGHLYQGRSWTSIMSLDRLSDRTDLTQGSHNERPVDEDPCDSWQLPGR